MRGETVTERFKRLRKAADLSQSQLATQTGLSPGTIGDIERGRQGLGKYIDLLATALHTTPEHLRSGEEPTTFPEAMLSARETRLIERFRSMNGPTKIRLEDFAAGLQGSIKERRPRVQQTAQEIHGAKSRRSG